MAAALGAVVSVAVTLEAVVLFRTAVMPEAVVLTGSRPAVVALVPGGGVHR